MERALGGSTGNPGRYVQIVSGYGLLSLMRLHGEGLGREHCDPWKVCSDSLRIWASVSIGAPVVQRGNWCLGGRILYRGL